MKHFNKVPILFLILASTSCSHKTVLQYNIESNPSGGRVEVDGVINGNTPATVNVKFPDPSKQKNKSANIADETHTITVFPTAEMKGKLEQKSITFKVKDYANGSTLTFNLRIDNPFPVRPVIINSKDIKIVPNHGRDKRKSLSGDP